MCEPDRKSEQANSELISMVRRREARRGGRLGIEVWWVLMIILSMAAAIAWGVPDVHGAHPWRGVLKGVVGAVGVIVYYLGLPCLIGLVVGAFSTKPAESDEAVQRQERAMNILYYSMIGMMIPPPLALVAWLVWRLSG
jgi:hypothetical protein